MACDLFSMKVTLLLGFLLSVLVRVSTGDDQQSHALDRLIRETQDESRQLAEEINKWTVTQTRRILSRDVPITRARRSLDSEELVIEKRNAKSKHKRDKHGSFGKDFKKNDAEALNKAMLELMAYPTNAHFQKELKRAIKRVKQKLRVQKKVKSTSKKRKLKSVAKVKKTTIPKGKNAGVKKKKTIPKQHKAVKKTVVPQKHGKKDKKSINPKLHAKKGSKNRKLYIMKGVETVSIDHKTLKIIKKIPKSALHKLLKKSKLDKYLKLASYLSLGGEEEKEKGKSSDQHRKKSGIVAHKKPTVVDSHGKVKTPKKLLKIMGLLKHHKIVVKKAVKHQKNGEEKSSKAVKRVIKKSVAHSHHNGKKKTGGMKQAKKKSVTAKLSKTKVKKAGKRHEKGLKKSKTKVNKQKVAVQNAKKSNNVLSNLKEKVKKANSLKFKVAKALLAHCETQNKLKKIFETVNMSLKNAASLAKAIGNKYGIKREDVEKITSHHTESAVQEFLSGIF